MRACGTIGTACFLSTIYVSALFHPLQINWYKKYSIPSISLLDFNWSPTNSTGPQALAMSCRVPRSVFLSPIQYVWTRKCLYSFSKTTFGLIMRHRPVSLGASLYNTFLCESKYWNKPVIPPCSLADYFAFSQQGYIDPVICLSPTEPLGQVKNSKIASLFYFYSVMEKSKSNTEQAF